jgi:hypothetical protein
MKGRTKRRKEGRTKRRKEGRKEGRKGGKGQVVDMEGVVVVWKVGVPIVRVVVDAVVTVGDGGGGGLPHLSSCSLLVVPSLSRRPFSLLSRVLLSPVPLLTWRWWWDGVVVVG